MKYEFIYTKLAQDNLERMDAQQAHRIIDKLEYYMEQPNPLQHSKPLQGIYRGLFRFRIGDYRAIFSKDAKGNLTILSILTIKHRRNSY